MSLVVSFCKSFYDVKHILAFLVRSVCRLYSAFETSEQRFLHKQSLHQGRQRYTPSLACTVLFSAAPLTVPCCDGRFLLDACCTDFCHHNGLHHLFFFRTLVAWSSPEQWWIKFGTAKRRKAENKLVTKIIARGGRNLLLHHRTRRCGWTGELRRVWRR